MLGNSIFFNRTIRTITTAFGSLFSNIVVSRWNYNTNPWTEQERFLLKVVFGQKEKYIQALSNDPTNTEKIQIALPILAYNFLGLEYDKTRKGQTTLQNTNINSAGNLVTQFAPVPYNFHYQVYIYVRNIIDGDQIVEQILPFFTPDYSLTINTMPSMGITQAIPFVLNSAEYELLNEGGSQTDTRYILWTLDFTAMGWLYGPTSGGNSGGLIKEAIVNIYDWNETDGKSLVLLLNQGQGTYLPGEIVFQGNTIQSSTATAYAQNWSGPTQKLTITNAQGMFITNNPLQGEQSGAIYNIINYEIIPQILETIDVTANTFSNDLLSNDFFLSHGYVGDPMLVANVGDTLIYNVKKTLDYDPEQLVISNTNFDASNTLVYNIEKTFY